MIRSPTPNHREQIALFRHSVIGDLLARELGRGELRTTLQERAKARYRAPGAKSTRQYSWKTLQTWYYEARRSPMALLPASRQRGFARSLTGEQRNMLLQMRRMNRSVSVNQILSEAVRNGILLQGQVSESTVCRLFRQADLPLRAKTRNGRNTDVQRRRWSAKNPGDLWHGDVCHLVMADSNGGKRKVKVHGFMDDASRHFVALVARETEQERDMLEVLCGAFLQHPPPKVLYLDNGSCYRGDVLGLVCQRLGIRLVHAQPYNPESRGKMERVWRTMRSRCTDHLPGMATLHDIDQALWAWLDGDYHRKSHASLMGATPRKRYLSGKCGRPLTALELATALEITTRRRIKKDGTFTLDGTLYEIEGRHLFGQWLTLVSDGMTGRLIRVIYQGKPVRFGACDPVANGRRSRAPATEDKPTTALPFDPIAGLLQRAREVAGE